MFLHDESSWLAALDVDPSLHELALSNNVIPASPTNLIGLLRAVHYGWQQETIAEGARQISDLGRELYKRLSTMGAHVSKLGRSLDGAVKSYNETVGSLERQVLPQARRFEQHGITGVEPPELAPIERQTRTLSAQELVRIADGGGRSRSRSGRPTSAPRERRARAIRPRREASASPGLRAGTARRPVVVYRRARTRGTPERLKPHRRPTTKELRRPVSDVRNVIIIGGGPAGYTAALYSARANLQPLVIEGFNWGGQLMITSDVENYPGYADGVMGPAMMQDFRRQAERFGAEFLTDDVTRVDFSERPFRVYVGNDEYLADSVIVATGASARQLGLESELRLQGRGVSYCATCDASFFRDKVVTVVGGGDSALEEATFISRFASKVYLVHRREEFRASPIMVDRARADEKIEFVLNKVVEEVLGDDEGDRRAAARHRHRRAERARDRRVLRRDRPRPEHGALPRAARPRGGLRLPRHEGQVDRDEHPRRLRRRRRAGSHLPAGRHRGRLRDVRRRSTPSGS